MKKFISMVMAAAMVVSLVPATAFAANTGSFKVVDAVELTKDEAKKSGGDVVSGQQIQIVMGDVDQSTSDLFETFKVTLDFDGAEHMAPDTTTIASLTNWDSTVGVWRSNVTADGTTSSHRVGNVTFKAFEGESTYFELTVAENGTNFKPGDMIVIDWDNMRLTSTSEGHEATVTVGGKFGDSEPMVYASVLKQGLDLTVTGKPVEVAEEEVAPLKPIEIEPVVSTFDGTEEIKVKVSNGFEFVKVGDATITGINGSAFDVEDESFKIKPENGSSLIRITGLQVEAVSADAGDVATITVTASGLDSDSDEAAVVIAEGVVMSVDEDEDVPVFYSGVNANDSGLTSGDDHISLEVTIEETVYDSWDFKKAWNLELPEGVYVVDGGVDGDDKNIEWSKAINDTDSLVKAFGKAYRDGDYEGFEFGRRAFDAENDKAEMSLKFTLKLVADPDFEGPVTLKLTGDAFDEAQEVVIAEFVKPVVVEAAQNDLVIDYKETVVPTSVVIKEAEAGLWNDTATNTSAKAAFALAVEEIKVEDATIEANEDESGIEIDVDDYSFVVDEESDDAAAAVTVSDIELYMERNIPAGAYELWLNSSMYEGYLNQKVFAAEGGEIEYIRDIEDIAAKDVDGAAYTVKEAFVNVITAGRDQDDASFTKKVVVPVGAMEIVAGEDVVALDVPAYINAAGYTMLPVRAVAVALGINTNNVIWDQATKTVTILYGQRIITMTVGQKVINVNGSAIPASAAVEVVNGRTFLGLRDLATALGVVDITWDAATQTATLNGNQ